MNCRDASLVIHPGAPGDILLSLPAIRALRIGRPAAIGLIARTDVGSMLVGCGEVDAAFSIDGTVVADLMADTLVQDPACATWLSRCESAIAWMSDPDGTLQRGLERHGVTTCMIRSPFDIALNGHQSDRFAATLQPLLSTQHRDVRDMRLCRIPDAWKRRAAEVCRDVLGDAERSLVLLHPGAGSQRKCVEPAVWSHVITACRRAGTHVCLVEGPADRDMVESVRRRDPDVAIIRNQDLETVTGLLSLATLYIGLDSGISHLAALVGCRTVALFVATDFRRWRPLGDHVAVVNDVSADVVTAAVHAQLGSSRLVPSV